ncbi:MAG TPA: MaoC/PaaZ C-terminal domain-containing protein [Catenuloplanes sp.]|jgi:acyl dehydratase
MPIDPGKAIGARLPDRELAWTASDVLLYHLGLGAGAGELRYVYERDLTVLPTFAVVAGTLRDTEPPTISMPGVEIDLATALHGRQDLVVHRPLPVSGRATARSHIVDVYDKGNAAVIVTETSTPYFTSRSSIFARGAGGFGGARGPSTRVPPPPREPDAVLLSRTSPDQALWYRLCGDRNPLHVDPAFAALAGFPRPILHGLCTYGVVAKAVVDALLDGDPTRVAGYGGRFAGVVFPGETLRTRIWRQDTHLLLTTSVADRDDAPALSDATLTLTPPGMS